MEDTNTTINSDIAKLYFLWEFPIYLRKGVIKSTIVKGMYLQPDCLDSNPNFVTSLDLCVSIFPAEK